MTNTEKTTKTMPSRLRAFLLMTVASLALAGGAQAAAPAYNAVYGNGPRPPRHQVGRRMPAPGRGKPSATRIVKTKLAVEGTSIGLGLLAHLGHAGIEEWQADRAEERQEKLMEAARQNSATYTETTVSAGVGTGVIQGGSNYGWKVGANGVMYPVRIDPVTGKTQTVAKNVKYDYGR